MNIDYELLKNQYDYLCDTYAEKDYSLEFIGVLNLLEELIAANELR